MADILDAAQKQIDEAAKKLSPQPSSPPGPPDQPKSDTPVPPPKPADDKPSPTPQAPGATPAPAPSMKSVPEPTKEPPKPPASPSPQPKEWPATPSPPPKTSTPPAEPPATTDMNASPPKPTETKEKQPDIELPISGQKSSFAIGVKTPTVNIPRSPQVPGKPSRKSILLAVLLFLLLTIPLGVYYVSQEQQLADLRSRAYPISGVCQLSGNEICVGNNPTEECYLGGDGNEYWCQRLNGNPGREIVGSTDCTCPSPYTWGPRDEYGTSWCFNTAVICDGGIINDGTDTGEWCATKPGELLPGCPQPTSPPPQQPTPLPTVPPGVTPTRTPTPTQGPTPTRTPTPTLIPTAVITPSPTTPPVGGMCELIRVYDANGQDITTAVANGTRKLAIGETVILATTKGNATKARFRIQGITSFEENDPALTTATEYRRTIQIPSTITQPTASFEVEVYINGEWK